MHIVYGIHAVDAALTYQAQSVERVFIDKAKENKKIEKIIQDAKALNIPTEMVGKEKLDKMAKLGNHQGVLIEKSSAQNIGFDALLDCVNKPGLLVVLDGVQDPHNLGACLRTADALAVDGVIIPKDKSAKVTATVAKVACGALETTPLVSVTNIARSLADLKKAGYWIVGTDGEAEDNLYEHAFTGPIVLVMGAEGTGLRRLTQDLCDFMVKIPLQGQVESLNVSVATGICLYEIMRQRAIPLEEA